MRHKYATEALVLGRIPVGEDSVLATLLTHDFGLIRARSQAARKRGSKMSAGLQTLCTTHVTLLRGKDGWRMAGAVLHINWARELDGGARRRAARVLELTDRLIRGEHNDPHLYELLVAFLTALKRVQHDESTIDMQDALENIAVVRLLQTLGLDAGTTFGALTDYSEGVIDTAQQVRAELIARINKGIVASGL